MPVDLKTLIKSIDFLSGSETAELAAAALNMLSLDNDGELLMALLDADTIERLAELIEDNRD